RSLRAAVELDAVRPGIERAGQLIVASARLRGKLGHELAVDQHREFVFRRIVERHLERAALERRHHTAAGPGKARCLRVAVIDAAHEADSRFTIATRARRSAPCSDTAAAIAGRRAARVTTNPRSR